MPGKENIPDERVNIERIVRPPSESAEAPCFDKGLEYIQVPHASGNHQARRSIADECPLDYIRNIVILRC